MKRTQYIFIKGDGRGNISIYCPQGSELVDEELLKKQNMLEKPLLKKEKDGEYIIADRLYGLEDAIALFGYEMNFKYVDELSRVGKVMVREIDI